jgi:hypothetical protein
MYLDVLKLVGKNIWRTLSASILCFTPMRVEDLEIFHGWRTLRDFI